LKRYPPAPISILGYHLLATNQVQPDRIDVKNTKYNGTSFMTLAEVELATTLKKSAIYTRKRDGEFPQNVEIAGRRKGWLSDQIEEYIGGRRDWGAGSDSDRRQEITEFLTQGIRDCHAGLAALFKA
jgi:predicted DNA-binding transcriptional regulator AlpA